MTVRQWAGFTLDRPLVMGILNVTPDSFSDGGRRPGATIAIEAGLQLAADGADLVDVGGESTRPGSEPVPADVELARIMPVISALARAGIAVSVDTRNAVTMQAALDAGARVVNDVSGLTHDPAAASVVASRRCPVVLMHMRGTPATMMRLAVYGDVVSEVAAELLACVEAASQAGVAPERIALDPGIGFAKRPEHSIAVLRGLPRLQEVGYPLLVGVSRKGFIGTLSGEPQPDQRLGGSLAAGIFAVLQGAAILRVHDVKETVQTIRVWQTLTKCGTVPMARLRDSHNGDAERKVAEGNA